MAWRDTLQPGSFRSVPFLCHSHDHETGRRAVTHEYPDRDVPWTQDLGRTARRWSLEAFVVGPDYPAGRDRLLAACEGRGAGELVHPYLGRLTAVCVSCRLAETTREGGYARLALEFVEAGLNELPTERPAPDRASRAADTAFGPLGVGFAADWDLAGQPDWVPHLAEEVASALDDAASPVRAALAQVSAISGDPLAAAAALVGAEAFLDAGRVVEAFARALWAEAKAGGAALVEALATLAGRDLAPRPIGRGPQGFITPNLRAGARAAQALSGLISGGAALAAVRAADRTAWPSAAAALAGRDRVAEALETAAKWAATRGDDGAWAALLDVRAVAVGALTERARSLPRTQTQTPPPGLPAIVLAHRLYGDRSDDVLARADDLVARNGLRHPLFVPARPLELPLTVTNG